MNSSTTASTAYFCLGEELRQEITRCRLLLATYRDLGHSAEEISRHIEDTIAVAERTLAMAQEPPMRVILARLRACV